MFWVIQFFGCRWDSLILNCPFRAGELSRDSICSSLIMIQDWRVLSRDESWRVVTSRVTLRWSVTGVTGVTESMLRRVTTCYDAALESSSRVFLAAVSPGAGGRWPPRDRRNPGALGSTTLQPLQDVGNCWNMEKIGTYFQHIFNILELVGTNWREVTKVTRAQDMNSTRFFSLLSLSHDGPGRSYEIPVT